MNDKHRDHIEGETGRETWPAATRACLHRLNPDGLCMVVSHRDGHLNDGRRWMVVECLGFPIPLPSSVPSYPPPYTICPEAHSVPLQSY